MAPPGNGFLPFGRASRAPVRLCRSWRRRKTGDFRAEARTHFIDREQKTAVPCRTRSEIPPCCPCAALCETIGYRAPVVPANQDVAAKGPLQAKDETRKRMSKGLPYFPFQRRIFFSLNMILPPLVMAVSLEPGAFDFRTRIKGGGRKAPTSRSQRPAERGVSRDCGISPQRRARWSLTRFFEF